MTATYTKNKLSESTNGKPILVTATSTPGTLIHTAVSGIANWDEIWLYAVNTGSGSLKFTVEWGDSTFPTSNIEQTLAGESGLYLIAPGLILQNSTTVRAFAASANLVTVVGFVNSITG